MPELRNEISFTGADLCAGSIEVPCSGCQTQITITPLANLFEKFEEGSEEVKCPCHSCRSSNEIHFRTLRWLPHFDVSVSSGSNSSAT